MKNTAGGKPDPFRGAWRCRGCGETHTGLFDLAAFAPDPWRGSEDYEPNADLRLDGDFLSEDFCVMDGKYFFVRSVLRIPVRGMDKDFGFGCWSTLSRENFDKYIEGFDDGEYPEAGPWTGWLCNRLADYIGATPEGVWVHPQPDRQRPMLRVANHEHPLAIAQENGITVDRLIRILEFYGHAPA